MMIDMVVAKEKVGYKIFRKTKEKTIFTSLYNHNYLYSLNKSYEDQFKGLKDGYYFFTSLTALCKSFEKILKVYNVNREEIVVFQISIPPKTRISRHARGMARTEKFSISEEVI